MRPTIRIVDDANVGAIAGSVDSTLVTDTCLPKVYVYSGTDVLPDDLEATGAATDVDPLVVAVATRHFGVTPGERLRIHVADGRTFLAQSRERWDLIIIDAYTTSRYGDTIPAHLTTREFFTTVAEHLAEGGIAHFHCAFDHSKLFQSIHATMAGVFPHASDSLRIFILADSPHSGKMN